MAACARPVGSPDVRDEVMQFAARLCITAYPAMARIDNPDWGAFRVFVHTNTRVALTGTNAPPIETRSAARDESGDPLVLGTSSVLRLPISVPETGPYTQYRLVPVMGFTLFQAYDGGWIHGGSGFVPLHRVLTATARAEPVRVPIMISHGHEFHYCVGHVDVSATGEALSSRATGLIKQACERLPPSRAYPAAKTVGALSEWVSHANMAVARSKYAMRDRLARPNEVMDQLRAEYLTTLGMMPFAAYTAPCVLVPLPDTFLHEIARIGAARSTISLDACTRVFRDALDRDASTPRIVQVASDAYCAMVTAIATTASYQTDYIRTADGTVTSDVDWFDKQGLRIVGDCEDFSDSMQAVHNAFAALPHDHPDALLAATGAWARQYEAVVMLCLVTRPNASSSESFGAVQSSEGQVNAHMTLLLVHREYLGNMIARTRAARTAAPDVAAHAARTESTASDTTLMRDGLWNILLCEGTGETCPFIGDRKIRGPTIAGRLALFNALVHAVPSLHAFASLADTTEPPRGRTSNFFRYAAMFYLTGPSAASARTSEFALVRLDPRTREPMDYGVPIEALMHKDPTVALMPIDGPQSPAGDDVGQAALDLIQYTCPNWLGRSAVLQRASHGMALGATSRSGTSKHGAFVHPVGHATGDGAECAESAHDALAKARERTFTFSVAHDDPAFDAAVAKLHKAGDTLLHDGLAEAVQFIQYEINTAGRTSMLVTVAADRVEPLLVRAK